MAHFAKISNDNKVLTVLVFNDSDMLDKDGNSSELVGQQYLEKHNNWPADMWIQTSYNTVSNKHVNGGTPLRGNFASIGYEWDKDNQIFWPRKKYSSWVKHIPTATWKSPIGDAPALTEEQIAQNKEYPQTWTYSWNEINQIWDLINFKIS